MIRLYVAAAALVAALAAGWYITSLRAENARLDTANAALVADLDRLSTERANEALVAESHIKKLTALRGMREAENAELSKATAANPDWAGQRVPSDVLRALGL